MGLFMGELEGGGFRSIDFFLKVHCTMYNVCHIRVHKKLKVTESALPSSLSPCVSF